MSIQLISQITALIGLLFISGFCIYKYTKQNRDFKI